MQIKAVRIENPDWAALGAPRRPMRMGLGVGRAQPRLLSTGVGQMLGPVHLTGGKANGGARLWSAPG